jgi:uncharacterized protein (TIGR02145 family)
LQHKFGALYNWHAVNTGNLAPEGWHVPTDAEWTTLSTYLGSESEAGGKMKEVGTTNWQSPNIATNESLFSALPAGYRSNSGVYGNFPTHCYWWSSTDNSGPSTHNRYITNNSVALVHNPLADKASGFSIRLVRN